MIKIVVPASTSNLGPGFDTFGLALGLYNIFLVERHPSYRVCVIGEGTHLPRDTGNLMVMAYRMACSRWGVEEVPLKVIQINRVPTARGLGSSATAIVGGITACERIHNLKKRVEEKVEVALELEPHPDNILPALVGGLVVCAKGEEGISFVKLDFPEDLRVVVCVPSVEVSTEEARKVLRGDVSLQDAVFNVQRSCLLLASLMTRRYSLLKEAVKDRLHQPYRSRLVPAMYTVMEEAYTAGALASFLSGSGPTVASLCQENCEKVGQAMVRAFKKAGVEAKYMVLQVDREGTRCHEDTDVGHR